MNTMLTRVHRLLEGDRHDPDLPECDSMSLRLEKFVRIGDNTKKDEIQAVVRKRAERIASVKPKGAVSFSAKLGGRLIVNQAGGVLENAGLCIHPHYNAPYIPGSAVKGCARHAAWQAWEEAEDGDAKINAAREIAEIFGFPTGDSKPKKEEDVEPDRVYLDEYLKDACGFREEDAHSGKVAFLAAVPETTAPLVIDLVNCHHREYYAGKDKRQVATDDEAPIPNFFPAVKEGTAFTFTLAPLSDAEGEALKKAEHFLKVGLSQNGIGAKTAAGYGWFDIPEDKTGVSIDESLLKNLGDTYLKEEKPRTEALKKDYKKGKIVIDTDERKHAFCQFLSRYKIKIGGEWQKAIDNMFEEFGMEVL